MASISAEEFLVVRNVLKRHAALVLDEGKEYLVEARLGPLAHREGFSSLGELITRLRIAPPPDLCQRVVEAMTIHETSFFRDWRPFEVLRQEIIPRLMRTRGATRELNIWSAACSSGQEPYSLSVILREHFPQLASWTVRIIATDISNEVLARAKEGRFNQLEVNRGLPAMLLVKYFERKSVDFLVKDDIKRMVTFQTANLAGAWPTMPKLDLVLMRNVLIYFSPETKREIFGRLTGVIKPDAFLMLGTGETTYNLSTAFERSPFEGVSCFQLAAQGNPACK